MLSKSFTWFIPDSCSEQEGEEVGDDEGVDDLPGVARRRPLLLAVEPGLAGDAVEGPAGVVGAQLARRRGLPTSDNVRELPLPAKINFGQD